jgi:hypothetical protein
VSASTRGVVKWLFAVLDQLLAERSLYLQAIPLATHHQNTMPYRHVSRLAQQLQQRNPNRSARTLQHLLQTVLAIRIRLLKIILLLIQIRHLLGQRLTLSLQALLHVWNSCADKPSLHI